MKYAILAVLCLATSVFGTPAFTYDAGTRTFAYTSASDLGNAVDPLGVGRDLTDPAAMSGNLTKDAFNALAGLQVVNFNGVDATYGTHRLTSILTAAYDPTHAITFTDFGDPGGYPISGYNSVGKSAYSGANTWDTMGTNQATGTPAGTYHIPTGQAIGLNWFAASVSVNQANAGVSAIGFLVDGRNDQMTNNGLIWVTLSDATEVSFPYIDFAGANADHGIGFFYQAPAGKFVTRVEGTRNSGSGNSYIAIDDLAFVIGSSGAPHYIQAHAGDANNDGAVDVIDLGVLATNYDKTGLPTSATDPFGAGSWKLADFNNDGNVDVIDLGVLATNYDWAGAPATAAVPEPGSAAMFVMGALALLRRYTRK